MGTRKENNQSKVWECVLHMRGTRPKWVELAHGTLVSKGESGSLFEIRFKGFKTTVLQVQHTPRWKRSIIHRKDEKTRGKRVRKSNTSRSK